MILQEKKNDENKKEIEKIRLEINQFNKNFEHASDEFMKNENNYSKVKQILDQNLNENINDNLSILNNNRRSNDFYPKKNHLFIEAKKAFSKVISVAKEIQKSFKNFKDFFIDSIKYNGVLSDFFEFFDEKTELLDSDIDSIFLFLNQIRLVFCEIFDILNLNYLFRYHTQILGKSRFCNFCNQFFPHNSDKIQNMCDLHIICMKCKKKNKELISKKCFCKYY